LFPLFEAVVVAMSAHGIRLGNGDFESSFNSLEARCVPGAFARPDA
jgi:hypothetical protein